MHLSRVGLHTLQGEHCIMEADLWLHYPAPAAVECNIILCNSLHELDKVHVMLLWDMAVSSYIIMDGYDTRKTVSDLVHVHLKDVLAHLQAKGHVQQMVPPSMGVEGHHV